MGGMSIRGVVIAVSGLIIVGVLVLPAVISRPKGSDAEAAIEPATQTPAEPVAEEKPNIVSDFYGVDLFASASDFPKKNCQRSDTFGFGMRLGTDGVFLSLIRCDVKEKPEQVSVYFLDDERTPELSGRLVGVRANLTDVLGSIGTAKREGYLLGFQKRYGPMVGGLSGMIAFAKACRPDGGDCLRQQGAIEVSDTVLGPVASYLCVDLVSEAAKVAAAFERREGEKSFDPGPKSK